MMNLGTLRRPFVPLAGVECAEIATRAGKAFGVDVRVAVADRPASIAELSPGERRAVAELSTRERAISWLRGRTALKVLIPPFGDQDTTQIVFPSRRYSLTHSGTVAVAAFCGAPACLGIGIDLEWDRPVPAEAARFYLTDEMAWVASLPESEREPAMLRLWTIKEAVFKADPRNAETVLSDYAISSPDTAAGICVSADLDIRYICSRIRGGYLSLAIAMRRI